MKRREDFLYIFIIFLLLSLFVYTLSRVGILNGPNSAVTTVLSPLQRAIYGIIGSSSSDDTKTRNLKEQNMKLTKQLADQQRMEREMRALRDQFEGSFPKSDTLLPANVIGAPSFVPGLTVPEAIVIDKGESDKIKVGSAVIFKDNLLGKVVKTLPHSSTVELIIHSGLSFTARTARSGSLGVIKGQSNGEMILDNVMLSDDLQFEDIVLTAGDITSEGIGFPANLFVGKIVTIDKKPSAVFQRADVASLIDFTKLYTVFVVIQPR